jgi:HlyD family secretion protein
MVTLKRKAAVAAGIALAVAAFASIGWIAPRMNAQESARSAKADGGDDKRWQAVAPGRVEPASGEVKLGSLAMGAIGEVLVKANDKVFAGEPLIRLTDAEAQARLASAEMQVALRRRARNDEAASNRAAARRRAEDGVADAERAIVEARAALDKAAIDRRAGSGSDADVEAARTALARAGSAQAAEGRTAAARGRRRNPAADPARGPAQSRARRTVAGGSGDRKAHHPRAD